MLKWDPAVKIKVLNNCTKPVTSNNNDDTNDCSIVLSMAYNKSNLLFMGDAEQPIEDNMIRDFKADLPAYALKVGHHGSRGASSTEFLDVVKPKVAIISVGVDNVYGHPHKEAIDRLRASGAKIFMTKDSGTQSLTIPAPKRGVEPVLEGPVPYDPAAVQLPAAVKEVVYVPSVEASEIVNTEALDQLQQAAVK
jgi:beta-lactamase superfamily II metal-dependent hydrolase